MSQIKKLLFGEKIPKHETGGKYTGILDGQTFTLTDQDLQEINNEVATLDPRLRMYLGGVSESIKSGSFKGNRPENTMSLNAYSGLSEKELDALNKGKKSYWEAIVDAPTYRAKEAANAFLNILSRKISKRKTDDKTRLSSDYVELDFNTDKEGKKYASPYNYSAKNRVRDVLEHLQLGDQSHYNTEGWDFNNINSWLNSFKEEDKYDAARKYFENLWTQMGTPGFDTKDEYNSQDVEDLLNMFRIRSGNPSAGVSTKTDTQRQLESEFKDNPNLYDIIGEKFEKGKDGIWRLKPGVTFNPNIEGLTLNPGQGIYFNDDFYNSRYGTDPRLAALKGLTYYGGALYTLDNPTLQKILNIEGGYNDLMRRGNWTGADNIILTRFTEGARNNPVELGPDKYSTFLSDKNRKLRYIDQTGLRTTSGMDPNHQIIQYVDLLDSNSLTEGNPYRRYNYKWALLDNRGNWLKDLEDTDVEDITNGNARENGLLTYKRISDNTNKDYYGRYYEDILDSEGNASGFRMYYNPDSPNEDIILHMPQINASNSGNKDLHLPSEVAKILSSVDPQWIDNIVGNAQAQNDFVEVMSHLTQKWHARTDANGLFGTILGMNDKQKLRRILKNDDEVNAFLTALNNAIKGKNARERQKLYYTTSPRLQKLGGILKQQNGGRAGGTTTSTGVTEKRANVEGKNFKNAAGITEIGSDAWTQYDSMDLAALIGDLGSLAAAFVPGANVASAGIGAASSSARFAANKGRGTKGAGLNYAADLAMDAATLLPLLGAGAKGAKVVKAVKNALPLIIKAASVYGLGSAVVNSATKIANGEKWTPKDLSIVVNALTAGVGLSRQGGLGKKTTKVNELEPVTLKGKSADSPELTLSSKQMEKIKSPDDLMNAMFIEAKKVNSSLTKEQFAEQYDVDSLIQTTQRWRPGWNPKTWFSKKEVKKFKPTVVSKNKEVAANKGSFKEWWHGVGDAGFNQFQYQRQLLGHNPIKKISNSGTKQEIVIPENTNPGLMDLSIPAVVRQVVTPARYISNSRARGIAVSQWINPFTNANYQRNVFEQPVGLIYEPQYKNGGVIKAQSGIKFDPNWKPGKLTIKTTSWQNPYEKTHGPEDPFGINDSSKVWNKPISLPSYKVNDPSTLEKPSWYTGKWPSISKKEEDLGGGYNYNIPDRTRYINPLLSGVNYFQTAIAQKRDLELEKKKAIDSIHSVLPYTFTGPNMSNPIFGRAINNINNQRANGLLNPFQTNDAIANYGLWSENMNRLDNAESNIIAQASSDYSQKQALANEAHDKTVGSAIDVANNMSQQIAAANIATNTGKQIYNQRRQRSNDALIKEVQYNVAQDRNALSAFAQNNAFDRIDKQEENNLKLQYPEATNKYYSLSYSEREQYDGLADYIIRTVPGAVDWISEERENNDNKKLNWKIKNGLNYNYDPLTGRTSSIGINAKKGGRINKSRSYEPSEQIWIDNNKATNNQIAKLSDQIIKLFLKTLK